MTRATNLQSRLAGLSASLVPESEQESRQLLELDRLLVRSRLTDINTETAKGLSVEKASWYQEELFRRTGGGRRESGLLREGLACRQTGGGKIRRESLDETGLFAATAPSERIRGFYLQPDPQPVADGKDYRNILLDDRRLTLRPRIRGRFEDGFGGLVVAFENQDAPARAATRWTTPEIMAALRNLGLPLDSPLSVLCVEMMPTLNPFLPKPNSESPLAGATFSNAAPVDDTVRPLSDGLGHYRILRTSPLTEVPAVCCAGCT